MMLVLGAAGCSPRIDLPLQQQISPVVSLPVSMPMSASSTMLAQRRRTKAEVADAYLFKLSERGDIDTQAAGFAKSIRAHFDRLPTRYALDVSIDSLDVLSHKRLLEEARADTAAVSFAVRPVEVIVSKHRDSFGHLLESPQAAPQALIRSPRQRQALPKPAFGSSPNLQALAIEAGVGGSIGEADDSYIASTHSMCEHMTFFEITVASADQPKLLSRLTEALSDLGLNIREAHAFNTNDGFSLDVFVVDQFEQKIDLAALEDLLGERLSQMPLPSHQSLATSSVSLHQASVLASADGQPAMLRLPEESPDTPIFTQVRPGSPVDDWEIDIAQLEIDAKIASGAFSNLYRGYYCGQEVAVKILKDVHDDTSQYQEFLQEVSMMRKVRHKNIVQFIGACTRKPNLCIVFEFMSGGSIYDWIRREGSLRLSQALKIATEVARGMDYLHQRKIIHRDLKTANLLMDEHNVVKIADFGVARIIQSAGVMTAETGTYRWMAPEVIEHKPYDEKADVFSFGVVIWELLTCRVPYSEMTPLQAAVGVVQKGLRPPMPPGTPAALGLIMESCWAQEAAQRPSFRELTPRLQSLLQAAQEEDARRAAAAALAIAKPPSSGGGLLSKLRGKG